MKNPEQYIFISSASGAHGKFLSSLMFWLANDITELPVYGPQNHYHIQAEDILGYTNIGKDNLPDHLSTRTGNFTFNDDVPYTTMVFAGGIELFFNDYTILERFPNFKNVIVTMTEDDLFHVEMNHFWKSAYIYYCEQVGVQLPSNFDVYRYFSTNDAVDIITQYLKLPNVTAIHRQLLDTSISKIINSLPIDKKKHFENTIKFSDILMKPEVVLETMSVVCEKPMNDFIRQQYYEYVETQRLFLLERNPLHPFVAQ